VKNVEGQGRCVNCDSRERGADEQSAVDLKTELAAQDGVKSDVVEKRTKALRKQKLLKDFRLEERQEDRKFDAACWLSSALRSAP
jgi:hypothetical protein